MPRMTIVVALFRGVNVGGHNVLSMGDLVSVLESLGLTDVRTYIQSGNAVFRANSTALPKLKDRIKAAVKQACGFEPNLILLDATEFRRAIAANPFPDAELDPAKLHLFFLESSPPALDTRSIDRIKSASERYELVDAVFYLHAPDGIGRSKLAAKAEKLLGVPATGRNWRTVRKLAEIAEQL